MIKTLKSELKLRPTYDEMIGMIESQGDENRPSIEKVIDRRATLFRNNHFGSQFGNIDFLGMKKQEEDRTRENLRQAQLTNAGINAGTSTGIMDVRASGFQTPAGAYDWEDEDEFMTSAKARSIRAEMERCLQRQQQASQSSSSSSSSSSSAVRRDLDEGHKQSLPVGAMGEEEDEMPPLESIEQEEEGEEEEMDEDPELIPDEETKTPTRKHKKNQ